MSDDQLRKLKAQQEANSAAIARMQMMMQAQNARRNIEEDDDEEDASPPAAQGHPQQNPYAQNQAQYQQNFQQQPPQQGGYQNVDPNVMVLQAITNQAANLATQKVQQNLTANSDVETKIKTRMQRLVADYPALQQEDSDLVIKSREVYARIASENPGLDEATRYELAVREAASVIGARPLSAPIEDYARQDYVMPAGRNPAVPTRSNKSRLTPQIIANAKLMGINVDPNTPDGKKNLAELSEYSARFNADANEDQYRYR